MCFQVNKCTLKLEIHMIIFKFSFHGTWNLSTHLCIVIRFYTNLRKGGVIYQGILSRTYQFRICFSERLVQILKAKVLNSRPLIKLYFKIIKGFIFRYDSKLVLMIFLLNGERTKCAYNARTVVISP